jgi:hypothetical protein
LSGIECPFRWRYLIGFCRCAQCCRRKAGAPLPSRLLASAHPLRLVQAFATIEDRGVRRALLALTEGFARVAPGGRRPAS